MKTISFGFKTASMLLLLGSFMVGCGAGGGGIGSGTSDTTPPTVLSTSPANSATGVAVNAAITAIFSETMNASTISTSTFTLDNGATGTVTYSGTTATFTPTSNFAYNTTYTATTTTGTKDSSGNAMAAAYTWSFTTGSSSDTTPPTVLSTSPANSATGVAVNAAITAIFSETMNASTISTSTFTLDNGATGTVTYSGTTATFTPTSNLAYSTTYTATITTGVKDAAGNAMASNYTWSFTTECTVTGTAPGSLDTSFGACGKVTTAVGPFVSDSVSGLAIQSDGKIVNAGPFISSVASGIDFDYFVTRYNTNGSLDATFGAGGTATTASAIEAGTDAGHAIIIQSDGKIVAGWTSIVQTSVGSVITSQKEFTLARYNTDGTLDATFGTGGLVLTPITSSFMGTANGYLASIAIQSDGKIVAAGYTYSDVEFALVRYNTDGTLDTSFGTGGKVTTPFGGGFLTAMRIQTDGKMVAVWYTYNSTTFTYDFALARYNANGTLDATFGTGGKVTTAIGTVAAFPYGIDIQSNGKIVVAGTYNSGTALSVNNDFVVVRYNADGSLDATFGTGGIVGTSFGPGDDGANAVIIQSNGKIVAVGFGTNGTNQDFAVARYNSDGTLDASFGTGGKVTTAIGADYDIASAIAIQSDGKMVVSGRTFISGLGTVISIVRYLP